MTPILLSIAVALLVALFAAAAGIVRLRLKAPSLPPAPTSAQASGAGTPHQIFVTAEVAWQDELIRLYGRRRALGLREQPRSKGAPGSELRRLWEERERAHVEWLQFMVAVHPAQPATQPREPQTEPSADDPAAVAPEA